MSPVAVGFFVSAVVIGVLLWGALMYAVYSTGAATSSAALEAKVSALSDKIAELGIVVDRTVANVTSTIADLKAKIVDLEARIAAGTFTPEDLAALDALKEKVKALDPTDPTVLPAV